MAQLTDHTRAGELFSAYIDQRVTPDERAFVERHVATCAACRAQLQATRSTVAALKAMPVVKAPRSFVLPKSMARQPKPSIFNWYPALRLATVMAAVAFVLVFASDLLTMRPNGGGNVIMSIPSTAAEAPAPLAPEQTPAAAPQAQLSAPAAAQPTAAAPLTKSAQANQQPSATELAPAGVAPAAGGVAGAQPTMTSEAADTSATNLSAQVTPTETMRAYAMTTTTETTTTLAMAPTEEPTPIPAVEAPAPPVATVVVQPAIDPLRIASIVLGGLVVVLGAATLIVRRGA